MKGYSTLIEEVDTCTTINQKVMPPKADILPKGMTVTGFDEFPDAVFLDIELTGGFKEMYRLICPVCGCRHIRERGTDRRSVKDIPYLGRQISLELNMREFRCMGCGRESFVPELTGFADKKSQMTVRLKEFVVFLAAVSSYEGASRILECMSTSISGDTVARICKDYRNKNDQSVWNAANEIQKAVPTRYYEHAQIEDLAQNLAYYMTPRILSTNAGIRLEAMKELFDTVFVKKKKSPGCSTSSGSWKFGWK